MMTKKVFIGILGLCIVGAGAYFLSTGEQAGNKSSVGIAGDPVDLTVDFYSNWQAAMRSTSTDPYLSELHTQELISADLQARLLAEKDNVLSTVMCLETAPTKIRSKEIARQAEAAQILVLATDTENDTESRVQVTLRAENERWQITEIKCGTGEVAPEKEFDFQETGFLLKSVPAPYIAGNWHVVYEKDGVLGHVVPIFFDGESSCISAAGDTAVCNQDDLVETTPVTVAGSMSEEGLTVQKLEFVQ